jgi:catechol 2,3-dioxygenase-like lactoylglutathione lyase family enzyme
VALFHPAGDFQALQQRLRQNGATLIAPERETPFERFFFRDPNGYVFEVIDQDGYCDESS